MPSDNIEPILPGRMFHCQTDACGAAELPQCVSYCLHCGYDIRASLESGRCPECGLKIPDPRQGPVAGEPCVRSAWWRVWVPLVKPARLIWLPQTGTGTSRPERRTLVLIVLAVIALVLASFAQSWEVHRVEWVFACDEEFVPDVLVFHDSSHRPKAPRLQSKAEIPGRYSFGTRSVYEGLGFGGGTHGGDASPGIRGIYWPRRDYATPVIPAGLPVRKHYCEQTWVPPSIERAVEWAQLWPCFALTAAVVNLLLLPWLLLRINRSGAACTILLKQGFRIVTQGTCIGLILLGLLTAIGAANPGNWLFECRVISQWIARVLLLLAAIGPGLVAARGVGFERTCRLFPLRRLSMVVTFGCHVVVMLLCVSVLTACHTYL